MKLQITRIDEGEFLALPEHLLTALGVSAGDLVDLVINEDGSVRIDPDQRRSTPSASLDPRRSAT
jgi:antitoxin component of MazEF toxin-antitoxin module